jgi:class 3 adenylate cyclase
LHCAAKIIRSESGEITAYDGDRVMAVFIGGNKNTSAVRAALKINYARSNIINPGIIKQYPSSKYEIKHVVGIDSGELYIARTGIRGANDLVWVGRAANHAAKLCSLSHDYPTWITEEVYDCLENAAKFSKGNDMWEARTWTDMNRIIYRSTYWWGI